MSGVRAEDAQVERGEAAGPSGAEEMREILIPYAPREHQDLIHQRLKRFNVLVCHRRFGKTVLCINELIKGAVTCERERPRLAYLAPLYRQAKQAAWDYLKHYTSVIPGVAAHESELRVDLPNGARVQLFGADNPDALRGIYLDGAVLDEYAQMPPKLWSEVVRPAITDRLGWAIFIGTPKGRNTFCELYENAKANPDWYAGLFKASETEIIPKSELDAALRDMGEDQYAQEFECSFQAALVGAYYGKLLNQADADGRITRVPWEPTLSVYVSWDLGVDDSTALWFAQVCKREIRLIDYYESSGYGLDHYVKVLRDKPYTYAQNAHIWPHDMGVRELSTGKSRLEIAHSLGLRGNVVKNLPIDDGISAARMTLPRCYFDAEKCKFGLEALRQYQRDWDDEMKVFRNKPRHDWTSHAADSFRYLCIGLPDADTEGFKPIVFPKDHVSRSVI